MDTQVQTQINTAGDAILAPLLSGDPAAAGTPTAPQESRRLAGRRRSPTADAGMALAHFHHGKRDLSAFENSPDNFHNSDMQGAIFLPHNPHQGFPPPSGTIATEMEASPSPNQATKEALANRSDSGIFSSTTNTTIDQTDLSKNSDSDNRSDCSSPERKYVCPICERMLTSQHEFTLHIRSHNNENEVQDAEKGFTCRICQKVLSSNSSLDRHVLVHSGERPFHCKYCGDTFTTNGNMHRHMRTHSHKSENYESDGSTDSSSSKSTEFNNNKVEKTNSYKRKNDSPDGSSKRLKENGSDSESSQSYSCPVCERSDFNSLSNLEAHLEDNHPDYPAKCSQCNHIFLNNKQLTMHRATVHENNISRHSVVGFKDLTFVDFSSEKFPHIARRECELNLHKVSGGLKFQCRRCNRAFPCDSSLEIHEKNCILVEHANGLDLSTISQPEIRRMEFFSRLNLLNTSPEKPVLPPQLSNNPNKLREHLAKAMDNTKDLADIQSILSNINLQQLQAKQGDLRLPTPKPQLEHSPDFHKSEQEEESQDLFAVEFRKMKLRGEFPCRLCTAVFPNLRALKGHNRAHLNGNTNGTYHCNMCPHSSIDKAALIRHMRTHNGDRPYECSLCNYAFTTKANCERHLRNRHAKTTREEVKKSIIYHPSEDPTNEDLNKLAAKEEPKKPIPVDVQDLAPSKVMCSTPKIPDIVRSHMTDLKPEINVIKPNIPPLVSPPQKIFPNINDIIRNENLRSLKEQHKMLQNGVVPIMQPNFGFAPQKIQVKSLEALKENVYDNESEEEYGEEEEEQPMDLVLDLSKKKCDEEKRDHEELPQDLTKKTPPPSNIVPPQLPPNMGEIFTQHLLKTPQKIDPAALYSNPLSSFYRNGLPGLPNWTGFLNPLLFQTIAPILHQNPQDLKERMQRFQLCGGSMIKDFNNLQGLQNLQQQSLRSPNAANYNGFKMEPKPEIKNFSTPKKTEDLKPLSLDIDTKFGENSAKLHSPIPQIKDLMPSPNSVKMVIKNGVLMPKQKQRRYRTERPFACEHCSARFTLRSNMERHIKQQHPQFWSQRQRGSVGNPGRKPQPLPMKPSYCDLSIPNYEASKTQDYNDTKELLNEKIKLAILEQQWRANQNVNHEMKKEEDEDCELVIDENEEKPEPKTEETSQRSEYQRSRILEEKLRELQKFKPETKNIKNEENQDLVPVSRLLDNASQQQFKEFFKREGEEAEVGGASEEDEEGLVASGSTSEGNVSGTDENRSESETTQPVKKKSAYSLAPNRVSCPYCSRKFPWTSSLRRHILTHTGQKPFKCSHCPLLFTTKSNCDRHLLRKHGNAATTINNDAGNNNNSNYLMRNVPERPFKCSSCPSSTFSTYSNLKKHISCKHSTNAQGDDIKAQGYEAGSSEDEKVPTVETKSDWESQLAYSKLNVDLAQTVQNSDLPFKCHLCEGSFSERQDALDHIRDRHASEYDLLMSKNALDNSATTPDEAAHQDDEESEIRGKFPDYSNRKVICAFCMRRFWSAEDLRRHMRTHTGERPFSCDICRRRFTLKHSMLRHRKKHNVNFENDNNNSDEDGNNTSPTFDKLPKEGGSTHKSEKSDESDCTEGGDLISNLLGLRDRSIIDKVLTASADDAAKLLGVKNGVKE